MKRLSAVFHILLLCLTLMACASSPAQSTALPLALREEATDSTASGEGLAVAFSVTTPLVGLEFECNITGENSQITVEIYKADTDYATTVSGDPQRAQTISHLSKKLLWQFDSLPPGDYIVLFSQVTDAELIKTLKPSAQATGKILHLRNGTVMTDGTVALTLFCTPSEENQAPSLAVFTYPIVEE